MRRFIPHVLRFSGESRAVPKSLGKKGKRDWLGVLERLWGGARVWLPENGLNFPPEPNEEGFGLLRQMAEIGSRREQRAWSPKLQQTSKNGARLYYIIAGLSTPLLEYYAKDVVMWVFSPLICLT